MQALLALFPLEQTFAVRPWRSVALFVMAVAAAFLPAVLSSTGGYTWSLLVFAVPSLAMARGLSSRGLLGAMERPLWRAWALLVPMGVALNFAFADDFFVYPSRQAIAGLTVPALDLGSIDRAHPIPLEEFAFYALGFLAMLLGYAWCDAVLWPKTAQRAAGAPGWLEGVTAPLLLVGGGVMVADQTPSYWSYLSLVPLPVTLVGWPLVRGRLNVPALTVTTAIVVLASFLWEAVLAVPRGWWGYQPDAMLGVHLFGLPLEATIVWGLAPVTTAVCFELLRLKGRP
ncbi:MAG: hypothetical protein GQE15_39895 [Archangiaceae bacterium]|nr:hypothetical protein [Archangiaceae bacterium]